MAKVRKFHFLRSRAMQTVERHLDEALGEGVIWHSSRAELGRTLDHRGRALHNFAGCSYMGLHLRPELIEGVISAVRRFGTQFSISRIYQSCELYSELETLLDQMTGRHALVAPSTTLAQEAALPAMIDDDDAVVIDQFAHASLHMAAELLGSTVVIRPRHSDVAQLEEKIAELSKSHARIWYVLDGLYSMRGDFAPFQGLNGLLARHPSLHLYVDDAHSTGWYGERGQGAALSWLPSSDRIVVRDLFRVLAHWPKGRYLELAPKYWAQTRARLDPIELAAEIGPLTVPPPLPMPSPSRE